MSAISLVGSVGSSVSRSMFASNEFQNTLDIRDASIGNDGMRAVGRCTPKAAKVHGVGLQSGIVECFHERSGGMSCSISGSGSCGWRGRVGLAAEEMEYGHGGPGASMKQQYRPSGTAIQISVMISVGIRVYAVDGEWMMIVGGADLVHIEAIEEV